MYHKIPVALTARQPFLRHERTPETFLDQLSGVGGEPVQLPDIFPSTLARQSDLSDIFGAFYPLSLGGAISLMCSLSCQSPQGQGTHTASCVNVTSRSIQFKPDAQAGVETSGRPSSHHHPRQLHRPQRIMALDLLKTWPPIRRFLDPIYTMILVSPSS